MSHDVKKLASVHVFAVESPVMNARTHSSHSSRRLLKAAARRQRQSCPGGRGAERPPGEAGSAPARQLLRRALRFFHDEIIYDFVLCASCEEQTGLRRGFFSFLIVFFCSNKRSTSGLIGDERMKGAERMRSRAGDEAVMVSGPNLG